MTGAILPAAALLVALGYLPALASPFVEIKLAALVMAGALSAAAWLAAGPARPRLDRGIALGGLALLLTTSLSAAVAGRGPTGAPYALVELIRLDAAAGVALGMALAVAAGSGGRVAEAIHTGAALVALIGLGQHLRLMPLPIPSISVPGATFGNRNIAAEAVAAALPFGLGLLDSEDDGAPGPLRGRLGLALLVIEVLYLAAARTRGAWLGAGAGLVVFAALRVRRLSRRSVVVTALIAASALVAAAVPGRWTARDARDSKRFAPAAQVVRDGLSVSSPVARTRLAIWRRTWAMFREAPLAGVGPGNFAVLFPGHAEPGAAADGVLSPTSAPRRAHDDLLERLAETGLLGAAALLALLGAAARAAVRARRLPGRAGLAAACAGSLAAVAGCGITGFPLAMPATLFLFAVAIGGLAAGEAPDENKKSSTAARGLALATGIALVACAAAWSGRRLAGSYYLARGEAALQAGDREHATRALEALARAARAQPDDFEVALRTAYAASLAGDPARAAAAAQTALATEPFSPNAWEALARARMEAGDARGAATAADRALELLHAYPGALYTRAQAAGRLGDAPGAVAARDALAALAATDEQARWLLARLDAR